MNNQLRAAELLRQAAAALTNNNGSNSTAPTPSGSNTTSPLSGSNSTPLPLGPSTSHNSVQAAVRNAFAPYRQVRGNFRCRGQVVATSYWTHRFCVLSSSTQETTPTREEKQRLFDVGLGEKKITFPKNDNPVSFKDILEKNFPSLENCGGYELLRTSVGSRVSLEKLRMPSTGFTANFLGNESNLGQACCYVRPIQRDIEMVKLTEKKDDDMVLEECLTCKRAIPLSNLREHIEICCTTVLQTNTSDEEDSPQPKLKRRKKQTPICRFMCFSKSNIRNLSNLQYRIPHRNPFSACLQLWRGKEQ